MRVVIHCGLALCMLFLAGCLSLSFGGKTTVVLSTGEQLTHLQSAYEAGALTEVEYDDQKQKNLATAMAVEE